MRLASDSDSEEEMELTATLPVYSKAKYKVMVVPLTSSKPAAQISTETEPVTLQSNLEKKIFRKTIKLAA